MNKCEIFIKQPNIPMPNSDVITKCYEEFGYKYMTLFFINNKNIFVDKEHDNIIDFIEDLYKDVSEKDGFVIVFHDENHSNFLDLNKEKLFYRTTSKMIVSKNECNCLESLLQLDKEQYKPFFKMFLVDNIFVEINVNSIDVYGDYKEEKGYIFSKTIKQPEENNLLAKIYDFADNFTFDKQCYICENNKINKGYCINHSMFVCNSCYFNIRCSKCKSCHLHFSPKYMVNFDICLECFMKSKFEISEMFIENSIGLKYIEYVTSPCKNIDLENPIVSKENVKQLLNNKTFYDLVELRDKTDEFVKKMHEHFYCAEKIRLFYNLQRKSISLT